jgi:hypothetical protein
MARLVGYRERVQVDIPIHIEHLEHEYVRVFAPDPSDGTTIVMDIAATRADVTIDLAADKSPGLRASGPWLTGQRETTIFQILQVANDALQEGKEKSAMEIIAEAIKGGSRSSVLRPMVISVRKEWTCTIRLNDGAPPGPVDVWLRTLVSRDVA